MENTSTSDADPAPDAQHSSSGDKRPEIRHKHSMFAPVVLAEIRALGIDRPSILEAGCETGWFAQHLADGGSYLGLGLPAEDFRAAQEKCRNATFVAADVLDWDEEGRKFDVVLSVEQLAMCPDHARLIARLASLVKPGGYAVITTENPFVYNRMPWFNKPLAPGQIRNRIEKGRLHALMEGNGLRIKKSFTAFPDGTDGFLWFLNAAGINRIVHKVIPEPIYRGVKESVGLGQFRVVVASRPH